MISRRVLDISYLRLNGFDGGLYHLGESPRAEHHGAADGDIEKRRLGDFKFLWSSPRGDKHKADDDVEEDDNRNEEIHQRQKGLL